MYALKCRQLDNCPYILIDKDFCEITVAQKVWPDTRLQLCFWHIVHAIKQRIASCKPILDKYDPIIAHRKCLAIDLYCKRVQRNEAYKVPNILLIKESIIEYKDEYIVKENDDNEYKVYEQNINDLNEILIKLLEKMIIDIEKLENQHTTPKTSKDFNCNTIYWL
ncbi:ATP-dependent DNA helicase pif1 [Gigaspora margarita]|uniref:ATP-dependent DNA helicase pif1 n=1 Tax=Gigaspora margarita TaxID=4874 RepID=A0A8H4EJW4_GIGMA|nr:ATP-dependent DNA helicase pif1 [Gigaspora margarita]